MKRSALRLNDFDGFERFLFTDVEMDLPTNERWYKYFSYSLKEGDPRFYQPIFDPKTIEEFQLCHYAYWMVIYTFELYQKPNIWNGDRSILLNCYACAFEDILIDISNKSTAVCSCPIKKWCNRFYNCADLGEPFQRWGGFDVEAAKEMALMEWELPDIFKDAYAEFTSPLIERSE